MAQVQISDVVVPENFAPYVRERTPLASNLVRAGVFRPDGRLVAFLQGGGKTQHVPFVRALDGTIAENRSSDDPTVKSTPQKMSTGEEIVVRMQPNQSWSSMDLASALSGINVPAAIEADVLNYWQARFQANCIATIQGVCKNNAKTGNTEDGGDYATDVAGTAFDATGTIFDADAFIDAETGFGDFEPLEGLSGVIVCHSRVHARMDKNDLSDYVLPSNGRRVQLYRGYMVILDDTIPSGVNAVRKDGTAGVSGIYETWLLGSGFLRYGIADDTVPVEVQRDPSAGAGGGQETLFTRYKWCIHPVGHKWDVADSDTASGGPSTAATEHNLNHADSFDRVAVSRKMVPFARIVSREHAPV